MKMMDFEQITTNIFKTGNLTVSLLILPNRKQNASGNLLTGSYINKYNSQKYNDRSQLSSLAVNFNTYISFEYLTYIDSNRINESVLVSYPHLDDLYTFLADTSNMLLENFKDIYTDQGIANEYNQIFTSEKLVSGKMLGLAPAYIDVTINETTQSEPGVLFLVKDDNYVVEMTLNQFLGMVQDVSAITNSFNLRTLANQVYMMGQMDYLIDNTGSGISHGPSGGGGESSVFSKSNSRPSFGGSSPKQSSGGLRRNTGGNIPRRSSGSSGLGQVNAGMTTNTPPTSSGNIKRKPVETEKTDIDSLADELNSPMTDDVSSVDIPFTMGKEENVSPEDIASGGSGFASEIMKEAANEEFDVTDDDIDF